MKTHFTSLILWLTLAPSSWASSQGCLYGESEGVSATLINSICQDAHGFVWVGTEYGLNKFDGIRFTQYLHDKRDSFSLPGNNVRRLIPSDEGRTLWVACSNGLQSLDTDTELFRRIRFSDGMNPHVTDVAEIRSGPIWIATSGRGLYSMARGDSVAYPLEKINRLFERPYFSRICEDSHRNIWIGINEYGLLRVDALTQEVEVFGEFGSPGSAISDILEDRRGRLYVSTGSEICFFDRDAGRFVRVPSRKKLLIRQMLLSHDGSILIGTDGQGLHRIPEGSLEMVQEENESLSFDFHKARIHALMEDRDHNLWLGCFQKGVLMMPGESPRFDFWNISGRDYRLSGAVTSICRDTDGNVWCSIDNEGIFRFDTLGNILQHYPRPQAAVHIFEDSERRLWVSTYDRGLAQMNRHTGQCRFLPLSLDGYVKVIAEDRRRNLYFSTFGTGLIRYSLDTKRWERIELEKTPAEEGCVTNRWITAIVCDAEGRIWLGHYSGVSCYDPVAGRFLKTGFEELLTDRICLSLMEDRHGNIWAGTYSGVYCRRADTGVVRNYTSDDGLSGDVVCGMVEDEKGDIWCSTFSGLNRISVTDDRMISYYTGNGLTGRIYSRGVYFRDGEGYIYFGGNSGITRFSPKQITHPEYNREVLLTNLCIYNRPVDRHTFSGGKPILQGSLRSTPKYCFSYEDNTFTFEFSTMDYVNPENIYYAYRLKELSHIWNYTDPGVNRVTYNHLPHGDYTLEVKACKYDAESPVTALALYVMPPWYKSRTAYTLYLLSALLICGLSLFQIDRGRRDALNRARVRFFMDLSYEIRSPMTLVSSPLEKLMREHHDEATRITLERMYRNVRRILDLIDQLLDIRNIDIRKMSIRCNETDMVGFIRELYDVFEDQAGRRKIGFVFEHGMENLPVWIDRRSFDKILMNLLANAFTRTPDGGTVAILLASGIDDTTWGAMRHYAEIRIVNTGEGIDEDKIKKIFKHFYQAPPERTFGSIGSGLGLNISYALVELHRGVIRATNREDAQGGCFCIRIPLGNRHLREENISYTEPAARELPVDFFFIRHPGRNRKAVRSKTNFLILIMSADGELRDFLLQILEATYKVITACNETEGFRQTLARMPHLILVDTAAPEADRYAFVKKLKNHPNVSHIPIVVLSSNTEAEDRMAGLNSGADAYFSKPFAVDELCSVIGNRIKSLRILKDKFSGAHDGYYTLGSVELKSDDHALVERVNGIIHRNLSNPGLSVSMLAAEVGLSRAQLHRKLKEQTGVPAGDFIRNIRMKQAGDLLKGKKISISQVAWAVGFSNQTHFSTAFKKFHGMSPVDYMAESELQ
ncbi:MAG: helix-turn-helix domain-containing protein [Tannerellaceae bacterium]|jgi:signal transduction histidine kinase/ligand-binding sensor domain-containing protein/AraC-like DNA-binding protein|nr:helix-turn-helix domain-containing protein [Tannerellaceae bacterium]